MEITENKIVLFGLDNYKGIIEKVIRDLNVPNYYFEIKLILTEALTNAFQHGNNNDKNKPIYLSYSNDGENIIFKIKDSGTRIQNLDLNLSKDISDEQLLDERGRGLFLTKSAADSVEIEENTLIIVKKISCTFENSKGENKNENKPEN